MEAFLGVSHRKRHRFPLILRFADWYNYFVKDGIYYICDFSEIILPTDLVLYAGPDPHEFAAQYLEENHAENEDYVPIFMDAPPEDLWPDLAK